MDVGTFEHRDVDRVLRPQHQVDVGVVGDRAGGVEVAFGDQARGHLERTRALLATTLDGGDLELLARVAALRCDQAEQHDHDDGEQPDRAVWLALGARAESTGEPRDARRRSGQREAELEHDPGEQDDAADSDHADEWSPHLGHPHRREWDASEREREAQRLDQRVGQRTPDHAPDADGCDQRCTGMEQREHGSRHEVAGQGQLDHPTHPEVHPSGPEEQSETDALPRRRLRSERHFEQHHADDRQWPETPRRHRQRHEDAGAERERRPREAPTKGRRGAFMERRLLGDDVGQVDSARLTTMRFAVDPSG